MKKQTKLVAVLSTAALLAIGASMTSFAATGWAEEDGTWVYYNRDGERATDSWKKSGNNWYYLDSDGEMAIDQLIEDGDNYYYVDINGVMASNQWVAIENEDAGEDDEPEHYWYYFQANGKALTNGENTKVALTVRSMLSMRKARCCTAGFQKITQSVLTIQMVTLSRKAITTSAARTMVQ